MPRAGPNRASKLSAASLRELRRAVGHRGQALTIATSANTAHRARRRTFRFGLQRCDRVGLAATGEAADVSQTMVRDQGLGGRVVARRVDPRHIKERESSPLHGESAADVSWMACASWL